MFLSLANTIVALRASLLHYTLINRTLSNFTHQAVPLKRAIVIILAKVNMKRKVKTVNRFITREIKLNESNRCLVYK